MQEQRKDYKELLREFAHDGEFNLCFTSNGYVTKGLPHRNIMGAGVAKLANDAFPLLDLLLAEDILVHGPRTTVLVVNSNNGRLIALPTKPAMGLAENMLPYYLSKHHGRMYQQVPGWMCWSSLELIEQSLQELLLLPEPACPITWLPRPGCANGGLDWENQVKPLCERYLDDRFIVCSKP